MLRRSHNFLHAKPAVTKPVHPAVKTLTVVGVALGIVTATVALIVAPFWYVSENVYTHMEAGKDAMLLAQQSAEGLQFRTAIAHIEDAEMHFASAQGGVDRLAAFSGAPYIGPHIVAADRLLASGTAASGAIRDVLGVADDLVAVLEQTQGLSGLLTGSLPDAGKLFKDLTPDQKRRMLAAFADGVPDMRDALVKIDAAIVAFDEIPQEDVAEQFTKPLVPFRQKLVTLRDGLSTMLPLAETVPSLLGYPEEKNYLFFFQNDTELRPTGGFLGVYGIATVRAADLAAIVTDDIYALDGPAEAMPRPAPPDAIRKYIGVDKWYLRDANWSPDFVVSSDLMSRFFAEEAAVAYKTAVPRVDGVFAIDTNVARDALRIVGPITVDGKTFNADNVVDELEFAVEKGFAQEGIPLHARKDIVGKLVKEVIARLQAMPVGTLLEAIALVDRNLKEGHILVSLRDPALQTIVLENDWGGKMKPVLGDYLTYVDANLASLKSDPAVRRTLSYSIAKQNDGTYVGSVRMRYEHRGRFDWKTTRYRTYARVYVPQGSTFLGVTGAMENDKLKDPARRPGKADVGDELGRKWFGAFISIEPGETRTLEFRYALAPSVVQAIKAGSYRLDVEKQAGTVAHGLTLDLDFGKNLTAAEPPEDRKEWGNSRYTVTTDLRLDRTFEVRF